MKKILLIGIVFSFFLLLENITAFQSGYIKEGQGIYWENNIGKLTVTPHTSGTYFQRGGFEEHLQFLDLTWYKTDTELDFAFQLSNKENIDWIDKKVSILKEEEIRMEYTCEYDFEYTLTPEKYFRCYYFNTTNQTEITVFEHSFDGGNLETRTAWWNVTIPYYEDISNLFSHTIYNNNHYYFIKNVPFKQDETKKAKIQYTTPLGSEGKWSLFIKPSAETLGETLFTGNYLRLDPWYASDGCSNTSTDYVQWDDGDTALDGNSSVLNDEDLNLHGWNADAGALQYSTTVVHYGSMAIEVQTATATYDTDGTSKEGFMDNFTIEFFMYDDITAVASGGIGTFYGRKDGSASGGWTLGYYYAQVEDYYSDAVRAKNYNVSRSTGWHKFALHRENGVVNISIDDILQPTSTGGALTENVTGVKIMAYETAYKFDDYRVYNGSVCPAGAPSNTVPEKAEILAPSNKQTLSYVDINYTAHDVDADTLTFYTYINGTLNGTSTANLTNWISTHNATDNHYGARVRAHDGTDYGAYSDMINFTVDTTSSLTVTLNAPDDNTINNTLTNNFLFTPVSEQYDLLNCTLYHNETGSFAYEVINTTAIINNSANTLTDTFAGDGIYIWNVECCDNNYNCNFSIANRTLKIDTTAPSLSNLLLNVTPAMNEQFAMNITVVEENPDSYRLSWNITGTMTNDSIQSYTLNPQNLSTAKQNTKARGNYICWKYWANDTAGNEAWSSESCFTVVNAVPSNAAILEPEHGDHLIYVDINYTAHDADGDTLTFHIYINGTYNSSSTNNITNWGAGVANGHYGVVVSAYDGSNFSVNSSMINFTFDTTDPTLTIGSNLRSNQTMVYASENITESINCSDATLFSLKVAVDEALFFSALNITSNSYNYNLSYNATEEGLSVGVHQIEINCSDGHTIRKIPDWNYAKSSLDKSIKYKFDDGWIKIKPTNKGLFSSFDTKKLTDRYTFEFKRDWSAKILYGNNIEFEVSSSDPLIVVSKKEYEGWLVSDHLNKWIDFSLGRKHEGISIEKISSKKVRIHIKGVKEDFVIFNSIGELNTVSEDYSFYFGNSTTETGEEQKTETAISTFTLGLNKNSSHVLDIDASLIWNYTLYDPTKTTSTDSINFSGTVTIPLIEGDQENMEYYWNYTITGVINNQSGNTSRTNQAVYKMIITNCSLNNLTTLSFSIYNKTDNLIAANTETLFTVWNDSSANKRNWNLSYLNSSTPKFCIAPSFAILNSDYRIEYTPLNTTLYEENLYAKDNQILTNSSQSISLYVYSGGTEITITVVDEYDEGKYGVIVMAYEYDISLNNFTLITTEETDLDGIVKMDLDISEKHKFIVEENGVNVYESPTMKLFQTSYTFRIGAVGEESVVLDLENLERSITWTEDTREIELTWNDISGLITQVYLEVYKTNVSNVTLLSQQISGSSSGTITYTLANESGVYIGNVYVDASADGNKYLVDFVSISELEAYDIFGTETLVASFFFIAVIIILGFTISAEVGLVISIISMAGFFFMGFIQMAPAGLIGIIISLVIFLVRIQRR